MKNITTQEGLMKLVVRDQRLIFPLTRKKTPIKVITRNINVHDHVIHLVYFLISQDKGPRTASPMAVTSGSEFLIKETPKIKNKNNGALTLVA